MIQICSNYEALSQTAAAMIIKRAGEATDDHGVFTLVLSGGETPKRTYELLAESRDMPWIRTHLFWSDERCVPSTDPRSNFRMVDEALLKRISIPSAQVHKIDCQDGPKASSEKYEWMLRRFFNDAAPCFDLALLGVGADGHTASLFPGTSSLTENKRWVMDSVSPIAPISRVTLSLEVINRSKDVVFLACGSDKAEIVRRVLSHESEVPPLPAQAVLPKHGTLTWLLDESAGSLLKRSG